MSAERKADAATNTKKNMKNTYDMHIQFYTDTRHLVYELDTRYP
jgi:hypothetical protein